MSLIAPGARRRARAPRPPARRRSPGRARGSRSASQPAPHGGGVERRRVQAAGERVETEQIGEVAGAVDDRLPERDELRSRAPGSVSSTRVARGTQRASRPARAPRRRRARAQRRAASTPMLARISRTERDQLGTGGAASRSPSGRAAPPGRRSWRQSSTRVAPPWLIRTRPACCSRLSTCRTACRLTPRRSARAALGGNGVARLPAHPPGSRPAGGSGCDRTGALVGPVGWTGCTRCAWHPPGRTARADEVSSNAGRSSDQLSATVSSSRGRISTNSSARVPSSRTPATPPFLKSARAPVRS